MGAGLKILKKGLLISLSLSLKFIEILSLTSLLFLAGCMTAKDKNLSLENNHFTPCLLETNCVSSDSENDKKSYDPPLDVSLWQGVHSTLFKKIVEEIDLGQNIKVIKFEPLYAHLACSSKWLGFVDDLELRLDEEDKLVYFKSSSRVGRNDFGVNRERVSQVKKIIMKLIETK
jgi:uncharacterized protein (DUF1499 family)